MLYGMANNNELIPAKRDGALYNFMVGNVDYVFSGIGDEFAITSSASSFLITLGTGEGIVGGRHVTEETVGGANTMIQLEANSSGYVTIRLDLTRPSGTEAQLFATPTLRSDDLNNSGTIRDLPLYQYTTNANGVSSFTDVRNISGGSNVICTMENGKIYVDMFTNSGTHTRKQVGSLDPSQLTATPADVKYGKTFGGSGSDDPQTGTFEAQTKSVNPTKTTQTITADSGKYLSSVTVNAIAVTFKTGSAGGGYNGANRYTDSLNTTKTYVKTYFITACNGSYGIEGRNSTSDSWSLIASDSTQGSSSASADEYWETKTGTTSYQYIRAYINVYNNGRQGMVSVAIGV